ncbi:hypothetical protein FACS1894167_11400 [Synergistales bacterium]|nr:hypothetical protein FACS1894167_11400 [Synergistales bacterium]GHV54373.1 hypothetical protein FACS1894216_14260 [Synergistales bacterium]
MIKMMTAYTIEVDDPEAAVSELLEQIERKGSLLENTVGIVSCYYEFIETGAISALSERLPFDVIGCTVMGSATNEQYGLEQMTLVVLTSDDIRFSTALSEPISTDAAAKPVEDVYRQALEKLPGEPSLIFALGPITSDASGEIIFKALNAVSGNNIPIFGTLSNDTSLTYENSRTFLNGQIHQFKLALLLMHGPINPRFYVTAISDKNIQQKKAVVTESEGYLLKRVNDMPLLDYLATIGVQKEGLSAITALPFLVDYGDGTKPIVLSMYSFTEAGAYCPSEMPAGTNIALAEVDYNSVMETAETTVRRALEDARRNGASGVLAIPCLTRILVISPNSEDEMKKTADLIGEEFPFAIIYSGGEMCPVYTEKRERINRFHNLTYTLMVF